MHSNLALLYGAYKFSMHSSTVLYAFTPPPLPFRWHANSGIWMGTLPSILRNQDVLLASMLLGTQVHNEKPKSTLHIVHNLII